MDSRSSDREAGVVPEAAIAVHRHGDAPTQPAGDEGAMWQRWRLMRDPVARDELLGRHLPYARVIAAMVYARRASDEVAFDDCLQFARLGLIEAFDRYDPDGGASFRTFAASRMRGAVLDGIATLSERQQQMDLRRRLLRERARSLVPASCKAGAPGCMVGGVDAIALLAEIGVGLAVGFMLEDTAMFDDGAAQSGDTAYRSVALDQIRRRLSRHVDGLPGDLRRVVKLHYLQGHSFEQVAGELGLSRGRISQLHRLALQQLRLRLDEGAVLDATY